MGTIFRSGWAERQGTVVPDADSVKLTNDAVNLNATVLYADMANSTAMVDYGGRFATLNKLQVFSALRGNHNPQRRWHNHGI